MFQNLIHLLRFRKPARRLPRRYPFRPILESFEARWLPSSITWTFQGDGDFNTQANWTVDGTTPPEHRVPGPGDRANIPGNWTVTSSHDNTVDSLNAGPFHITGGTFTVNNLFNNSGIGTLVLSGGSLSLTVQAASGAPGMGNGRSSKERRDSFGIIDEAFLDLVERAW